MSLNWREIDVILGELKLPGSHIQKIRQPDFKSLVFDLFSPGNPTKLLICLGQGETRLHRCTTPLESGKKLQRFAQMLRARIGGGRIVAAAQIGGERIIRIEVARAGETTLLWIRLWGGAANVVATEPDGTILDAFYRRPKRGEVSGAKFTVDPKHYEKKAADDDGFAVRGLPGEGDFNQRVEEHYRGAADDSRLLQLKARISKMLVAEQNRLETRVRNIEKRLLRFDDADQFKLYADLIYAHAYAMKTGDRWLEAENYNDNGSIIRIELNPLHSPQQNAEDYYAQYRKAKSGRGAAEEDLANAKNQLLTIAEKQRWIAEASDAHELELLIESQKTAQSKSSKEPGGPPGLRYSSGQYAMYVGRTAKENDELLRKWVKGNDYWLHTRDYPGGYIFVKSMPGKSVPLEVLLDAGNLAVFYSKARNSGRAELYYTQVKHLRRAKDAKFGTVLPSHEKNLSIKIDENRLRRLLEGTSVPN